MLKTFITTALLSASLFTSLAQAAEPDLPEGYSNYNTSFSVEWIPESSTIRVQFFTGCRSAFRASSLVENFQVEFDRKKRTLDIGGNYIFKIKPKKDDASTKIRVTTADCQGSRSTSFDFADVVQGTYTLSRNSTIQGTIKLATEEQKITHSNRVGINQTPNSWLVPVSGTD